MLRLLYQLGWLACAIYSTIPAFWLMIHPFAEHWRTRHTLERRSPYVVLVPVWLAMWAIVILATRPWREVVLYHSVWAWIPATLLFAFGIAVYSASSKGFSARQLGGIPEVHFQPDQRLAVQGIRGHVRHPVYLAHLCEMLAWSVGTGLAVCWALTIFAIATGTIMIPIEDAELEKRFGDSYRVYRSSVPAVLPRFFARRQL